MGRLAAAEERFLGEEFLAPVPRGGVVHVRLAGVVCKLAVEPACFEGWGVFRPVSLRAARLVRRATLAERQAYLRLFPPLRLILCRRDGDRWLGLPAHRGDRRFPIDGTVPVRLAEDAQPFEVVEARFDGVQCWFERTDPRHDPATAAYLRQALHERTPPEALRRKGLTPEERLAYALCHGLLLEAERDRTEARLRDALAHAGAELIGYVERDDGYRIEYRVGGERHVSVVDRRDLTVQVAGVCLSGRDRHFDLQSLVGVLRAADGVVRVGEGNRGMAEDDYWRVHPPS